MDSYNNMKIVELKQLLRDRGVSEHKIAAINEKKDLVILAMQTEDSISTGTIVPRSPMPLVQATDALGIHAELYGRAGRLITAIDEVKKNLAALGGLKVAFPQIIVIGEESCGKSSVLERIAMLKFFPRDENICTRMPLEFRLNHISKDDMPKWCTDNNVPVSSGYVRLKYEASDGKDIWSPFFSIEQIEKEVKIYMDEAVKCRKGGIQGVVEDIMVIEVTSTEVPNLTLVDLPGIVGGRLKNEPEDMVQATRKLAEKYISQPHTMVLAVASARMDRIRNSLAMHLIQQYHKEKETIGVLTMVDRSADPRRPNDPYHLLKKRLDGTADDIISLDHGYIAVKNRDSTNPNQEASNLIQAATSEIAWFQQNLSGYVEKGKASSQILVRQLVEMLCSYVAETWVPSALGQIQQQIDGLNKKLDGLGIDPASKSTSEFIQMLTEEFFRLWNASLVKSNLGEDIKGVSESHLHALSSSTLPEYKQEPYTTALTAFPLSSEGFSLIHPRISGPITLHQATVSRIVKSLETKKFCDACESSIQRITTHAGTVLESVQLPLRLARFSQFKKAILDWTSQQGQILMEKAKDRFVQILDGHLLLENYNGFSPKKMSAAATTIIIDNILLELAGSPIKMVLNKIANGPSAHLVVESTAQERQNIKQQIEKLKQALQDVSSLKPQVIKPSTKYQTS